MTIDNLLSGKKVDALGLLNAQLELRFELMRAVTPKYSVYKYSKSPSFESSTTRLLQRWKHIDANSVPRASGLTRQEAVRKLHEWHDTGAIELQLSVVVHRFHALRHLVRVSGTKLNATVSESIYVQIEERRREREKKDLQRIQSVIDLVSSPSCISRLAEPFSDDDPVPEGRCRCRHCQFDETMTATKFKYSKESEGPS